MGLNEPHRSVVRELATTLEDLDWALTGSTSFALQGVPVEPTDVDVQTSESGAYEIERRFPDAVVESVSFSEADRIRSHIGVLEMEKLDVEVMGAVQKRMPDGDGWDDAVDVADRRDFVDLHGLDVPVLPLGYEARAYERLGRDARAEKLRQYAEQVEEGPD